MSKPPLELLQPLNVRVLRHRLRPDGVHDLVKHFPAEHSAVVGGLLLLSDGRIIIVTVVSVLVVAHDPLATRLLVFMTHDGRDGRVEVYVSVEAEVTGILLVILAQGSSTSMAGVFYHR